MSPEQRRGEPPDPRQDLYSLGVMWYQLLVGDVTRELHPGWARELEARHQVPREHIELIARCVGWLDERPRDARALLPDLRALAGEAAEPTSARPTPPPPPTVLAVTPPVAAGETERFRRALLLTRLRQVEAAHGRLLWLRAMPGLRWLLAVLIGVAIGSALGGMAGAGTYELSRPRSSYNYYNPPEREAHYQQESSAAVKATVAGVGVGLLAFGVTLWVRQIIRRRALAAAEGELSTKIAEVHSEFPQQVQAWGGAVVLREPELVGEVLRDLEARRGAGV
jgi:hypothetical protein